MFPFSSHADVFAISGLECKLYLQRPTANICPQIDHSRDITSLLELRIHSANEIIFLASLCATSFRSICKLYWRCIIFSLLWSLSHQHIHLVNVLYKVREVVWTSYWWGGGRCEPSIPTISTSCPKIQVRLGYFRLGEKYNCKHVCLCYFKYIHSVM